MAELTVDEAEKRLILDWTQPLRHGNFYKVVYRPAVLRANRLTPTAKLSPEQSFHSHSKAGSAWVVAIHSVVAADAWSLGNTT